MESKRVSSQNPRRINCFFAVSKACNLHCSYCYLSNEKSNHADAEVLNGCRRLLKKAEDEEFRFFRFVLHGAEALTLTPETIRELVEMVSAHSGRHVKLHTNATLLTAPYLDRLGELQKKLRIGASVDGPAVIHNQNRGKTYDLIWENLLRARDRGYTIGILAVVSTITMSHLEKFGDWLKMIEQLGINVRLKQASGPLGLTPEAQIRYGNWLYESGHMKISHSFNPMLCTRFGNACPAVEFDPWGLVYSCNKSFKENGHFANWHQEGFNEILGNRKLLFQKEEIASECLTCRYRSVCHSGCPLDRNEGFALDCKVKQVVLDRVFAGKSVYPTMVK